MNRPTMMSTRAVMTTENSPNDQSRTRPMNATRTGRMTMLPRVRPSPATTKKISRLLSTWTIGTDAVPNGNG